MKPCVKNNFLFVLFFCRCFLKLLELLYSGGHMVKTPFTHVIQYCNCIVTMTMKYSLSQGKSRGRIPRDFPGREYCNSYFSIF